MDPWTVRVAELNIQYYEALLAEGIHPTKAAVVRRLLAAEKVTLARLREEQRAGTLSQPFSRTGNAAD